MVFGIALGMIESCVACVGPVSDPVVVHNIDCNSTTRSVVVLNADGTYAVGEVATRSGSTVTDRIVSGVKLHMGDPAWCFSVDGKHSPRPRSPQRSLKRSCS